ncbi:MAG: DUF1599 domain-containing protein [Pseudoflavonifractor sp.]|nr:DUF1599 domain-containing protein [Alloprevotella sp.]MCM1117031.1 DUF1599 domain-containing protein [Pseudoflavonifractor sp.]
MTEMTCETDRQFRKALDSCRTIFAAKLADYGASWRIMRPASITDQIYIKAKRIRSLETKGMAMIDDDILSEFRAIVNYGITGLIQLSLGPVDHTDISADEALALYDSYANEAFSLMSKKNHDYDEAWRGMRVNSYTDFILTKLQRVKEMEDHGGYAAVSEGIDSNYLDIINYATFGIIKLTE